MKRPPLHSPAQKAASLALIVLFLSWAQVAQAGGPLLMGSEFIGVEGQPYTWSTSSEIQYTTDGGNLGTMNNATANARVASMFQVWEDLTTAAIGYNRSGQITAGGGDINTAAEFNALGCTGNPIVYDADGSLFTDLGESNSVIGFAGPCNVTTTTGRITSGQAALNGRFQDGINTPPSNRELTADGFDAAFIHEFGHFSGLDHSQINVNCLTGCTADELAGLPTMFPILVSDTMKSLGVDDVAWMSRLYPTASFNTSHGTITGNVLFSDGLSHVQGVNVIARQVDNGGTPQDESRINAVSVVSGYRFTPNPGQTITGTNNPGSEFFPEGSNDPALLGLYEIPVPAGEYTLEVEAINADEFTGGSSVGPLDPPFPLPGGTPEFWDSAESATDNPATKTSFTVAAGETVSGKNIILNNTDPRFDQFESAGGPLVHPQPFQRRERHSAGRTA